MESILEMKHDRKMCSVRLPVLSSFVQKIFGSLVIFAAFWLTVTPPQQTRIAQLSLGAIAVLGGTLSTRFPITGTLIAAVSTAAAWLSDATADPFLIASIGVFTIAEQHGSRRLPWWLTSVGVLFVCLALLLGGTPENSEFETRMHGALLSVVVLSFAWTLGVRTKQAREQASAHARTDERLRLARDVHDVLSHSLGTIGMQAGVAAHVTDLNKATLRETLHDIESQARRSIAELQVFLRRERAHEAPDDTAGLSLPISGLLQDLAGTTEQSGLQVELACSGDFDALSANVGTTVYRIVQEAVTNTIRHAKASNLFINIVTTIVSVEVVVRDDGQETQPGFREGHGLTGMRERVELLGGDLLLKADSDGFVVRVWLPLTTLQLAGRLEYPA